MAADDHRRMEDLALGLWMADAMLCCWLAAVVELMSLESGHGEDAGEVDVYKRRSPSGRT